MWKGGKGIMKRSLMKRSPTLMRYRAFGETFLVQVMVTKFYNGIPCVQLFSYVTDNQDDDYLEPFMRCSVNVPSEQLSPGEVIIKDYSENEGCEAWMEKNGVLEPGIIRTIALGFVKVNVRKLTKDYRDD